MKKVYELFVKAVLEEQEVDLTKAMKNDSSFVEVFWSSKLAYFKRGLEVSEKEIIELKRNVLFQIRKLEIAMRNIEHTGFLKTNGIWSCGVACPKCEIYNVEF